MTDAKKAPAGRGFEFVIGEAVSHRGFAPTYEQRGLTPKHSLVVVAAAIDGCVLAYIYL